MKPQVKEVMARLVAAGHADLAKEVGNVYLHVSNSGVTFRVLDTGNGPTIEIESSAFGNINNTLRVMTTTDSFVALSELFRKAAMLQYSEVYCNPAALSDVKLPFVPAEDVLAPVPAVGRNRALDYPPISKTGN